jgi:hypothetical protein
MVDGIIMQIENCKMQIEIYKAATGGRADVPSAGHNYLGSPV